MANECGIKDFSAVSENEDILYRLGWRNSLEVINWGVMRTSFLLRTEVKNGAQRR